MSEIRLDIILLVKQEVRELLRHNRPYIIVIDSHCLSKKNLVLEGKLKGCGEGRVMEREASLNVMGHYCVTYL